MCPAQTPKVPMQSDATWRYSCREIWTGTKISKAIVHMYEIDGAVVAEVVLRCERLANGDMAGTVPD